MRILFESIRILFLIKNYGISFLPQEQLIADTKGSLQDTMQRVRSIRQFESFGRHMEYSVLCTGRALYLPNAGRVMLVKQASCSRGALGGRRL